MSKKKQTQFTTDDFRKWGKKGGQTTFKRHGKKQLQEWGRLSRNAIKNVRVFNPAEIEKERAEFIIKSRRKGFTLGDIAQMTGLTRGRVWQIIKAGEKVA